MPQPAQGLYPPPWLQPPPRGLELSEHHHYVADVGVFRRRGFCAGRLQSPRGRKQLAQRLTLSAVCQLWQSRRDGCGISLEHGQHKRVKRSHGG